MAEISLFRHEPTQRTLAPGEILFKAGDVGEVMYGVIEGAIEIVIGDETVETVESGGILGEMALLGSNTRSALARAKSESVVAEIDQERFLAVVKYNPFFSIEVMKLLAERLRRWS